ncbi:solute carrier family 12 member 3 isoform X2 [Octopus bimaculoides]|uniref:Amino acid permease/ SLC12A domain-containing protein n=1 Tax=Octopus bimaculoides TaxID=37653 RepID=A0A0L8GHW2_OCTBM|nr:solute carrier family 12 member 3 isoform X2 [Octopus bimaculoides]|eukprot:XP_014780900.1 PREDICTED: solute carrier family 12 member 3-like isoform X1 [Octopus bimaculoides]
MTRVGDAETSDQHLNEVSYKINHSPGKWAAEKNIPVDSLEVDLLEVAKRLIVFEMDKKRLEIPKIEINTVPEEIEDEEGNITNGQSTFNLNRERFQVIPVGTPVKSAQRSRRSSDSSRISDGDRKVSISIIEDDFLSPKSAFQGHRMSVDSNFSSQTIGTHTHEALPRAENYRDLLSHVTNMKSRPTLDELHERTRKSFDPVERKKSVSVAYSGIKFGWIEGVLIRCMLNIFGVMLFLRLTWVTAQAGIGLSFVIILLSSLVTSITSISMSAICTNGEVRGGGAYYMISRSLGPEFGGAIGVIFAMANAIAAAMYIVGFAETVQIQMEKHDLFITGVAENEVRIIGIVTSFALLAIIFIGMAWESKAQIFLLGILCVAVLNYFVGTFLPVTEDRRREGFIGYNVSILIDNFQPDFKDQSFFSVFSIYFPSATGILAGANISGDLKDPQTAIPKGTFLSIAITTSIYAMISFTSGFTMMREVFIPSVTDFNSTLLNETSFNYPIVSETSPACLMYTCRKGGLHHDNSIVGIASATKYLILAGIFSATLSSALASLVSAPKVLQAVGKDKIYPCLFYFAKESGRNRDPRRAILISFVICLAMICLGSLNAIAPIISNFFLIAYALINFACFDASISNMLGFRPAFKYFNKWLSLLGALLCVFIMFLIQWWAALSTFVLSAGLFIYIRVKKPEVNWGSSSQAHAYKNALASTQKLAHVEEHVKNFRPQILLLCGYPKNRPDLVDFAASITKRSCLLICGQIFLGDVAKHKKHLGSESVYSWFKNRKIKAFYSRVCSINFRVGAQNLLQINGLGKLKPNTMLMGFKRNWQTDTGSNVDDYFNVIHDAFDLNYGVGILRVPDGFDTQRFEDDQVDQEESDAEVESSDEESPCSEDAISRIDEQRTSIQITDGDVILQRFARKKNGLDNPAYTEEVMKNPLPENNPVIEVESVLENPSMFSKKQEGTIDVWWLTDDGGLTLLVPYMLSCRKKWKNCCLRVFCGSSKMGDVDSEHRRMVTLLSKFRIDYSQITVIPDLRHKPSQTTMREFYALIQPWLLKNFEDQASYPWKISEADLLGNKMKTYRHVKLHEMLQEHSKTARLVVLTLPMPRKNTCPAGLYMSWLEMITKDMPSILLLRGNQQSVLTYYA